ncbi:sensor histidine kinase [Actinoplanes sp. NPDC051411]|uniref:sensor histidine kinase n=1 Tax=Actinoplanes sp. NPDC051411 TaxID=3155522 RepID=UPI0034304033
MLRRKHLIALDSLAAALATVVFLSIAIAGRQGVAACLLAAASGLPIAAFRLWPRAICGVVLAASLAWGVLDLVRAPVFATAYAMFHLSALTPRPRKVRLVTAALVSLGALGALTLAGTPRDAPGWWAGRPQLIALFLLTLAGGWTIGQIVRDRRIWAARAAEQAAERAVAEERLRIARELHDSVAHSMGVIAIKAAVAVHVAEKRPEELRDALQAIETTSKGALAEMRHLLDVLRTGEGDETAPPGMAALPTLARQVTAAGVVVELVVSDAERLPPTLELPVFRIVQEALTNVVKHAAPTRCSVTVAAEKAGVRVEVCDEGPPACVSRSAGPGGHGLVGMRERIAAYGGTFDAGPRPEGGFRVSALIPYAREPA